jgi:polyisoprenyl-teichoic acid--peptidoglycan teichoic acid transferase
MIRRTLRLLTLGVVLALAAVLVPDSAPHSEQVALVKVDRASGIAVDPDVIWILAVGSDARPGEQMTRTRGDALQLIGMNTKTGAATTIGIPRDSWVTIPGYGSSRINAALTYGGPQLLGRTVGELVGVQPDYVFVSRFPFFEDMVDDIGGIEVSNPRYFFDENLKPEGFKAGRIHLDGYGAMAFSRSRHQLAAGDFDRSANQQRVLRGIQSRIRSRAATPGFIERGVLTVMQHLYTDLGPAELYRLAQAVAQVEPGKITNCVVQGGIGNIGGASVVLPNVASARSYGNQARRDATIERC